jgi:hypothetical protein
MDRLASRQHASALVTTCQPLRPINGPATHNSWPDGQALLTHLRAGRGWVSCAGAPGQPLQACEWLARQFPGRVVAVPFQGEAQAIQAVAGKHVRPVGGSPRALEDLLDRNIQVQQAWQKKGL